MDHQKAWRFPSFNEDNETKKSQNHSQENQNGILTEFLSKKKIPHELAPEDFSHDDVQQLKKLNRELHVDNIDKTVAYIKLKQDYLSLKDEVATLRAADAKRQEESNELLKCALNEIALHQTNSSTVLSQDLSRINSTLFAKVDDISELNKLKEKNDELQSLNLKLLRQVEIYEDKYTYFNKIVTESSKSLDEYKVQQKYSTEMIQSLKSEVAIWKARFLQFQGNLCFESQTQNDCNDDWKPLSSRHPSSTSQCESYQMESNAAATASAPRQRQINKNFVKNAIVNYITPATKALVSADHEFSRK